MIKNKLIKLFMFSILISSLWSCSGLITKDHLKLSKGTALKAFLDEGVDFDANFPLEKLNKKKEGKFEIYISKITGATTLEYYYYAFKDDKLIYWGHPYKFCRNENPLIREIGEEAMEYLKKEYNISED